MSNKQILFTLLVTAVVLLIVVYFLPVSDESAHKPKQQAVPVQQKDVTQGKLDSPVAVDETGLDQVDPLDSAVRRQFADEPHIQKAWVSRGQDIVLKNYPAADAAEFSNTYFHRGFKDRAMTCGEVRFRADGKIVGDYQRFIYVGVQSSHLERDIPNFDLLWDKLCVQTYK